MKAKEIKKLARGLNLPISLEEVKVNRVVLGSELKGATVVGKTVAPNKYYKVVETKLRQVNVENGFVKFCKLHPYTNPIDLLDMYINSYRRNHNNIAAKYPQLFKQSLEYPKNEQG